MTISIVRVAIDCTDPQSLATFWTAALGTTVTGAGAVVDGAGRSGGQ